MRRSIALRLVLPLGLAAPLVAQPPAMIVDLNAVVDLSPNSDPRPIGNAGAKHVFLACEATRCGLWATDATAPGTVFLAEPTPGDQPFFSFEIDVRAVETGALVVFNLCTGPAASDCEPWRSDGTPAGTFRLKDIRPGGASSDPAYFAVAGGTIYFAANDGTNGAELWKSNGTTAGTVLVEDIVAGGGSSDPRHLTGLGAILVFQADKPSEQGLWRSDGSAAGTFFYSGVQIVGAESVGAADPLGPFAAALGGNVIFSGQESPVVGNQLYRTNGTIGGTALLKDIAGPAGNAAPNGFRQLGAKLLFTAFDTTNGVELWATDGLTPTTVKISSFPLAALNNPVAEPTVAGSLLYFRNDDDGELWKSDGTAPGTILVEANPAPFPRSLFAVGGLLCFRAQSVGEAIELWRSDGTPDGTGLVIDLLPGASDGAPIATAALGSSCLFAGDDGSGGAELWKSSLAIGNAAKVADLANATRASDPSELTALGGRLYFAADDGVAGRELHRSDGTAVGTVRVSDLLAGPTGSAPDGLTSFAGGLVFAADDGAVGRELFRMDGGTEGVTLFADVRAGAPGSGPGEPTPLGADLYFAADDGASGRELWRKTPSTLSLVHDIVSGGGSSNPRRLTPYQNAIFFLADDAGGNLELWKADAAGATSIVDLTALTGYVEHGEMIVAQSVLRFVLVDPGAQTAAIWLNDGTTPGTFEVRELALGPDLFPPDLLVEVGSTFFFRAHDETSGGDELWVSAGAGSNTFPLAPSPFPSAPRAIAELGGFGYFGGRNEDDQPTLWRSTGLAPEQALVSMPFGDIRRISAAGGRIYFAAPPGGQPAISDGTPSGTGTLGAPSAQVSGEATGFVAAANRIFFAADNPAHGVELWAVKQPNIFADGFESGSTGAWSAAVP